MPTAARRGSQTPTYSWCDSYARTEGRAAAELAKAYGMAPHPWQSAVLCDWLAMDDEGRLLNSLCLLDVPRQNGKTGVCDPRETWGLVKRGEWILHTAQEYQTARKAFDRLRAKFGECRNDPRAKYPELNRLVKKYTTSANQMVLDLANGAHIEFRTRGSSSQMGRGGTFDLVVIDEAQDYTDEQDAALAPLNSAAPHGSPQTILMGTVPDPERGVAGEVFARLRDAMHDAPDRGSCIHEWGVGEMPADVGDRELWFACNPSLGYQLLENALAKDAKSMTPEKFAMEHLGWHPRYAATAEHPIKKNAWANAETATPPDDGVKVFAVKFAPNGTSAALSVALRPDTGPAYVELIRCFDPSGGLGAVAEWLGERVDDSAAVVIDGQGSAQTLHDMLRDEYAAPRGWVVRPSASDAVSAYFAIANAVQEGRVEHYGQPALTESATKCTKRSIGRAGGWGFESAEDADACLIESAALAYWGAMTTKRDQRITMEVSW